MTDLLFLAVEESIPASHPVAALAVPLGMLFFGGSVFLLLWSNYGAKKAGAIYGTAFFGFAMLLGVFWWFGAPGTPQNLGLTFLPHQEPGHYSPEWYAFEPGSERAEHFPVTDQVDQFQPAPAFLGEEGASEEDLEGDPAAQQLIGDLDEAVDAMQSQFLPVDDSGVAQIGRERRAGYEEDAAANQPEEAVGRAQPFYTAEPAGEPEVTESGEAGARVVTVEFQAYANYTDADDVPLDPVPVGEPTRWFAFYDPGGQWIPSALWTVIALLGFGGSLFALDRLEMRDKRLAQEVEEPEDVAVPVAQ